MDKLQKKYNDIVVPGMMKKFGFKNPMAVPRITKITVNSSFGKQAVTKTTSEREKMIDAMSQDISMIAGQMPTVVVSKKSIAGFKLREGLPIAAMVTLRKGRMWDFLERLIYLSLPKSRDFKGVEMTAVDNGGNLNMGFREHINFPEIFTDKEKTIFGLQVTISTNAKNREYGLEMFRLLGFPLRQEATKK